MTEFVIETDGEHGTFLVDGERPALFGEIVGCDVVEHFPPEMFSARELNALVIKPQRPTRTVNVTLRLPLGPDDHATILQRDSVRSLGGPTADYVATTPDTAMLARRVRGLIESFENGACFGGGCPCESRCDVHGFEEMRTALFAVLAMHESDAATVRALATAIGLKVDRG